MWDAYAERLIYLDANIVIYAMEESSGYPDLMRKLIESIDSGQIKAMTSELTLAEVLAKPIELRHPEHLEKYERFFAPSSALVLHPVSRDVLMLSARLRADFRLKLLDAIHVATAQLSECKYFLTEDERLGRTLDGPPKWLRLSDVTA